MVYLTSLKTDPYELPVAVFETAKECSRWIGVTPRHFSRVTAHSDRSSIGKYMVEKVALSSSDGVFMFTTPTLRVGKDKTDERH